MSPTKPDMTDPRVKALLHTCAIMGLEEEGFLYICKHRVNTVERLTNISNNRYAKLIKEDPSVINGADIDQINIFRSWYTATHKSLGRRVMPNDILKKLTKDEWSEFSATFVAAAVSMASNAPAAAATQAQVNGGGH